MRQPPESNSDPPGEYLSIVLPCYKFLVGRVLWLKKPRTFDGKEFVVVVDENVRSVKALRSDRTTGWVMKSWINFGRRSPVDPTPPGENSLDKDRVILTEHLTQIAETSPKVAQALGRLLSSSVTLEGLNPTLGGATLPSHDTPSHTVPS